MDQSNLSGERSPSAYWSLTLPGLSEPNCLTEIFEAQVDADPSAVAVIFQGHRLTYRELDLRVNRLARYLISRGVGREGIVALALERSFDLIVAILAVLKAGGAYLPLDPKAPRDRLQFIIQDSQSALLISTKDVVDHLDIQPTPSTILLDASELRETLSRHSDDRPSRLTPAEGAQHANLAYVIYTSGSTGRPKGVAIPHSNVMSLMSSAEPLFGFGRDDVWTLFHSYAFDFSVWEIWGALLYGGRLVIVDDETRLSPPTFLDLIEREGVTVLNQTPSAFYALMNVEVRGARRKFALRYVIFGGEALDLARLKPWFDRHGDTSPALVNMYGITETTVHVTWFRVDAEIARTATGSLIGDGIPGWGVHLLDPELKPVRSGEVGEIFVSGPGVAREYVGRPELTAQRFLDCPFGPPGSRMYRSGDLARRLPDGSLECLGRADQQVKINGFRIELGEIEVTLEAISGLEQAAVAPKNIAGETRLVAYMVSSDDAGKPDPTDVRAALADKLPGYMIPAAFVFLPALPLTINGKLDRAALPTPDVIGTAGAGAPSTDVELAICQLFAELTGASQVGVNDSFFDLGGHSLLAVRLVLELEELYQRKLPLSAVFNGPTAAELAQVIEGVTEPNQWHSLVPIHQGGSGDPIFMVQWLERDLAKHLSANRPVWGLSVGLARTFAGSRRSMPLTVEDTARHYIEEMQSVRPEGPYHLLGHSAGGVIAFEMARQLIGAGHEVGFLGLLDAVYPTSHSAAQIFPVHRQILNFINLPIRYKIQFGQNILKKYLHLFGSTGAADDGGSSLDTGYRAIIVREMLAAYAPPPCPIKGYYFKASIREPTIRTVPPVPHEARWATVMTGGLEVLDLDGDHMDIVKDPLAANTARSIEYKISSHTNMR